MVSKKETHNIRVTNTGYNCSCGHSVTTSVLSTGTLLATRHARMNKNSTIEDVREHPKGFRLKRRGLEE